MIDQHTFSSTAQPQLRIGVLAMQGAFAQHARAVQRTGHLAHEVRTQSDVAICDGLIIPGGESTAIRKALDRAGLLEPVRSRIERGLPVLGTCAGLIVLSSAPEDGAPQCFGLLDVVVSRNGFGRQVHSFEAVVQHQHGQQVTGVFIRAPRINHVGPEVEIIGTIASGTFRGEPVAVRQRSMIAATFHPELTTDLTLHHELVQLAANNLEPMHAEA